MPGGRRRGARLAIAASVVGIALALVAWRRDALVLWLKLNVSHPTDAGTGSIDERTAWRVFDLDRIGEHFEYDPVRLLQPKCDLESRWEWDEHPAGTFVIRTNDRGLYETHPVPVEKRAPRVLVAGDSHTAGLVDTDLTFSNLLEARLREVEAWKDVEVMNAGCAFTGPTCYLGTLESFLDFAPDVFVAVLFVGNDFSDEVALDYARRGWSMPDLGADYFERLRAAADLHPGPVSQGFNLAYRWKHAPAERTRARELVVEAYHEMARRCDEEGIRFLAVVLPTKMEVDLGDDAQKQARLRELMELTPEDVDVLRDEGDRFVAAMQQLGIECVDPRAEMRAADEPLYWRRDYHLGSAGHELLARLLYDTVASWAP